MVISHVAHARDIRVMVIDTGIDATHPFLEPYMDKEGVEKNPFDYKDVDSHGTHVAGIIAGANCSRLKIISCRFMEKRNIPGYDYEGNEINCFKRALDERIDIVNFSGGGEGSSQIELDVIKAVAAKGIKVVVAAGNENLDLGNPCKGFYPACYDIKGMTVVGATDLNGKRWTYTKKYGSNYGRAGMTWKLGEGIVSSVPGNKYAEMSGTSQATAAYTQELVKNMCTNQ